MLFGLEIGMLICGIIALISGKVTLSPRSVVSGMPARVIGIIAVVTLPVSFGLTAMYIFLMSQAWPMGQRWPHGLILLGLELVIFFAALVAMFVVGYKYVHDPQALEEWDMWTRRNELDGEPEERSPARDDEEDDLPVADVYSDGVFDPSQDDPRERG